MPKIILEDIEDYYTYYVVILGLSDHVFWNATPSFLENVIENKLCYDQWISYEKHKSLSD